jgi:hypothetical protein
MPWPAVCHWLPVAQSSLPPRAASITFGKVSLFCICEETLDGAICKGFYRCRGAASRRRPHLAKYFDSNEPDAAIIVDQGGRNFQMMEKLSIILYSCGMVRPRLPCRDPVNATPRSAWRPIRQRE